MSETSAMTYAIIVGTLANVLALVAITIGLRDIRDALRDLKSGLKGEDEDDISFVLDDMANALWDIERHLGKGDDDALAPGENPGSASSSK